ncbi:acidic amino acid decarboxylase GADL1 [Anabrus simplex]|uniref:acidic amino acid decarboxylase GADL1 n=1 Tax=Anabrus simplex TaxID=316456 RepID=UPI0035A33240
MAEACSSQDESGIFLSQILRILREEGAIGTQRNIPVVNFKHPVSLQDILSLDLEERGSGDEKLLSLSREVIQYSVKTNHPNFHNQLYAGVDPYGYAGALITEALNTNQYTFEVAPVFTLTEHAVLKHILKLIGFSDGDGIFSPGGSVSNMYAMVLARHRTAPDIKSSGLFSRPALVAFASQDSHYSALKAAHWLGLGIDNMILVKSDREGRMIPEELRESIVKVQSNGKVPFFVTATAGTTVLGAFDPLEPLADICSEYGLWFHVDACWGGSLILSKRYSPVLNGINRADSVAWNPHKMLGAPLQCSVLLIKEKGLLHNCNSASATYLFQQDKFYDVCYDTGDKSIQCGRKVDAFKLWLMWKARGDEGFQQLVDNAMDCARYFKETITERRGFRLVIPDFQCTNVCFWYIPPSFRNQEETPEWWERMHTVAPRIKEKLILAGTLMIGYAPLKHKGLKNFFRMVTTCQPPPTKSDMDFVIKEIEKYGMNL